MSCYYLGKRPMCYMHQSKDYVDISFWHSTHLSKKLDVYLVSEKRKKNPFVINS